MFEPAPVYLLTAALQGVVRDGTAQGLKQYVSPELNVAGKTSTTDELRDAWFAGSTGDRLAVVWLGYDDNRPSRLTGASGAMPVWGDLMAPLTHEPLVLPMPEYQAGRGGPADRLARRRRLQRCGRVAVHCRFGARCTGAVRRAVGANAVSREEIKELVAAVVRVVPRHVVFGSWIPRLSRPGWFSFYRLALC